MTLSSPPPDATRPDAAPGPDREAAGAPAAGRPARRGGGRRRALDPPGLRRLARAVQAEGRRVERDRRQAGSLFEVLIAAAPAERAERIAAGRRFASRGLAERLLAAAGAAARNRPHEARELCDLALAVVARLEAERFGTAAVVALRLTAEVRRAEALWWARDFPAAAEALAAALDDVDATPIGEVERALYCRVLALVRAGQGRVDEALALLGRAALVYRDLEETPDLASCLAERGWLLAEEDPRAARLTFRRALGFVDPASQPWVALQVRQGLAFCAAEMGLPSEARAELRIARSLAGALEDDTDRLRSAWTEARIESGLGFTDQAKAALPPVVEGWLARGEGYLAALAVVDLAEINLAETPWLSLADLDPLLPRLRAAGMTPESALAVRAVLGMTGLAPTEPAALYMLEQLRAYLLEHLRRYLWRARHLPGLVYVPCRAANRAVPWDGLAVEERLEICARVGVEAQTSALLAAAVPDDLRTLLTLSHQEETAVRIEWDGLDGVRARMRRALASLQQAQGELREVARALPEPSESELQEVLAGEREPGAAVLISGALDHLDAAYLEPAIRHLADAAGGGRPGVVR
jgi:tetratricopeptide (TPR) repeat protein